MKKIKITSDADGEYGYPKGLVIPAEEFIRDYVDTLNEVEDADAIDFIKSLQEEYAVDFIADAWGIDYKFV